MENVRSFPLPKMSGGTDSLVPLVDTRWSVPAGDAETRLGCHKQQALKLMIKKKKSKTEKEKGA